MTATKKIKVTLSDASPVTIDPELWPIIASADWFNGQHDFQANYTRRIVVREHEDGRRLVYGSYDRGPGGARIEFRGAEAGYLLDDDGYGSDEPRLKKAKEEQTIRAIRRVAGAIGDDELGAECIGDLPAQEI